MLNIQNTNEPWGDLTLDGFSGWSAIANDYEVIVAVDSDCDCDFIIETEIDSDTQYEYGADVYLVKDERECISEYFERKEITHLQNRDWIAVDDHLVPGDIVKYEEPVFSSYRGDVECKRAVIAEVMSYKFGLARGRFYRIRILISWKCNPYQEDEIRKRFAKTIEDKYQPHRLLWHNEKNRLSKILQLEMEIDAYENDEELNARRIEREAEIESKHIAKQSGEIRRLLWDTGLHQDFFDWNSGQPTFIDEKINEWKIVTNTFDTILEQDVILFGEVIYNKLSSKRFEYHCLCASIAKVLNLKKKRKGTQYVEIKILASTYHGFGEILLRKPDTIFKYDLYRHLWGCEHARMVQFGNKHKMKFASVEAYNEHINSKDE